jgi:catechol 2,3-dioxygenase-like lactoylglutathione lyase family enzyme
MTSDVSFVLRYVNDVAASEAFYASILKRRPIDSSPTFSMLPASPNLMLGLWRRDGVKPGAPDVGGCEIAFTAADRNEVDSIYAEWLRQGFPVAQAPEAMDFGYTFVVLDPDGQRVRVFAPEPN